MGISYTHKYRYGGKQKTKVITLRKITSVSHYAEGQIRVRYVTGPASWQYEYMDLAINQEVEIINNED